MITKSAFAVALDVIAAAGYQVHNNNFERYNASELRAELSGADWSDDIVASPDAQKTLHEWLASTAIVADQAARIAAHDGKDPAAHVAVREACRAAMGG